VQGQKRPLRIVKVLEFNDLREIWTHWIRTGNVFNFLSSHTFSSLLTESFLSCAVDLGYLCYCRRRFICFVKISVTAWIFKVLYSGIAVAVEFDNIDRQIYIFPFKVEKCKT
jgi:hypothetical protein